MTISAEETIVERGETIRITCATGGVPTPTITWLRQFALNDTREILNDSRIDINSFPGPTSNAMTSTLVIRVSVKLQRKKLLLKQFDCVG